MRENNEKNSRKRLNALILLVAFTAILLIVSTYAWFSTQRNVTLGGLDGKVNVAEGLQVSLDAKHWANEIDLSATGIEKYFASENVGKEDSAKFTLKNPYTGRTNFVADELLPVSTTAQQDEGIGLQDLNMYRGINTSGIKLDTIKNIATDSDTAANAKGYFAIDLFLWNSSADASIGKKDDGSGDFDPSKDKRDTLQLETNSSIDLKVKSKEYTGIQNSFRVAFALFDETDAVRIGSGNEDQQSILNSVNGKTIQDVAIWEPNASGAEVSSDSGVTRYAAHVDNTITNNNRLTFDAATGNTAPTGYSNGKFAADTALPTFALTAKSLTAKELKDKDGQDLTGSIADIYNYTSAKTTANGLTKQNTVQTTNEGVTTATELKSTSDGTAKFTIAPGRYVKVRMYVWLEGQDVDCINYASLGGGMTINVGLSKPDSQNS